MARIGGPLAGPTPEALLAAELIATPTIPGPLAALRPPAPRVRGARAVAAPEVEVLRIITAQEDREVPYEARQVVPVGLLHPARRAEAKRPE